MIYEYSISELRPLIAWDFFDWAWGMNSKSKEQLEDLHREANTMLDSWEGLYHAHAILIKLPCNSNGDDLLIEQAKQYCIPMLRQQNPESHISSNDSKKSDKICLSLADYIRPLSTGIKDEIGVFCTSMDAEVECLYKEDPYQRLLAQTLADRLAEAAAEKLNKEMPGIRPAVGYPSMPDMSINFILNEIMDMQQIGISLTSSGMMRPHASVSGLIFSNPNARYFNISSIGKDQISDYARRRGMDYETMLHFLKP